MTDQIERIARWLHEFATTYGASESPNWDDVDQGEYRYQAGCLLAVLRGAE